MSAITTLQLAFGRSQVSASIPTSGLLGVFAPQESFGPVDGAILVREALAHPIGSGRLRDLAGPGQKVVIVISDMTRPCPSALLLPPVLDELAAAGIPDADITVVVALGLHRPMTASEIETTAGPDVYHRVQVINHDPTDTLRLGVTAAGTPIELFRPVVEADLRVCLGNVELHYFAGYSGGAKAILPGCASAATVTANHAWMASPEAATGRIKGNPIRSDIEEGVAMVGVDFILNVLVDGQHRVVGAVAGDVTLAHRRGCAMVAQRANVPVPALADIVLVSAGGYPKDVNLYQAQKALDNATYAVRPDGIIILVAECIEGFGNQTFETWMTEARSPDDLLERIQREFVLGGHKAAAVARSMKRAMIALVSALPPDLMRSMGFYPFESLEEALRFALDRLGASATLSVMPEGGSVLPVEPQPVGE